jgi:hypothetical protein
MIQFLIAGAIGAGIAMLDKDKKKSRKKYAEGGRVSTYKYEAGRNPKRPYDVLGRKDGMLMYHTSQEKVKHAVDKAEELLENGYDEVLIGQP